MLLRALHEGAADVTVGGVRLRGDELAGAVGGLAARLPTAGRAAVWAQPRVETLVAVAAGITAGLAVVPVDPTSGPAALRHLVADSDPDVVLAGPGAALPSPLADRPVHRVDLRVRGGLRDAEGPAGQPVLVMYTSGTTGPPKGAVLSRGAVQANLEGLADAWGWTAQDRLVHALPLHHVHGLVLGGLGALRVGSPLVHPGAFSPAAVAAPGGTLVFAVPTMWHRVVGDPAAARALRPARLLVSGSARLPAQVAERLRVLSGQRVVQRYGMTETLILTATRHDGDRDPVPVGRPLPGVELRVAPDGEVLVRTPSLFRGYLGGPPAEPGAWFATGDAGELDAGGSLVLHGRLSGDLLKTGGYRVGAGEVEDTLTAHPGVHEAAVTGVADDDLGERLVAWVVAEPGVSAQELIDHVAASLAPHKRPREVRFVETLPRTAVGKVRKDALR